MVGYSPVGDITVLSICIVIIVLMMFSYIRSTRAFRIFLAIIGLLMGASISDVLYHSLTPLEQFEGMAYSLRCLFHALLFLIFVLFTAYIAEVTHLTPQKRRPYLVAALIIFCAIVGMDVWNTTHGMATELTAGGVSLGNHNVFMYGYLAFSVLEVIMLTNVRDKLYRQVMLGFYGSIAVSFIVLFIQGRHMQTSFTVATFLYPVIAMFYILHSNPYDAELGAIDSREFEGRIRFNYENHRDFVFISLYLRNYEENDKLASREISALIRTIASDYFKGALLFQISKKHEVLLFLKRRNPQYEEKIHGMLESLYERYREYGYDYKLVIGESIDEVSRKNEYVPFIRSIHRNMDDNTVHWVTPEDAERFSRTQTILRQLEDIYRKRDLNDPRVLAYCQPVLNIKTNKYDTAEALMRLRFDDTGLVFPDQFISLAEENGYIHVLTEIILHKTCMEIKRLMSEGYEVRRISVNVSVPELKDDGFCDDINRIIDQSGIPGDKIAIELTESQSESDFLLMKNKINELRRRGITFYLDDFGTGYSNMERIMELPFDIIKFDRSMVIASGANERSKKIVVGLANMFSEMDYSVLYEGVEGDEDERMCKDMSASYLQGYKYSRPVPIEELSEYFVKA